MTARPDSTPEPPTPETERDQLSPGELRRVLRRYDLPRPDSIRDLRKGNPRAPKALIEAGHRRYLLKRRAPGLDDTVRIHLEHAAQVLLHDEGVPVAPLIRARDGATLITHRGHVYELFGYVEGDLWPPGPEAAREAGRVLGAIHDALLGMRSDGHPGEADRREHVRRAFDLLAARTPNLRGTLERLASDYALATRHRDELGIDGVPESLVHGDFHPGNTLWRGAALVAVIDFETMRPDLPVREAAIAGLHFAMDNRSLDPRAWPDAPEIARLEAFWAGYHESGADPGSREHRAVPWLMIEGLIAEALPRACRPAGFGRFAGADILPYIARATAWLADHAEGVEVILSRAGR